MFSQKGMSKVTTVSLFLEKGTRRCVPLPYFLNACLWAAYFSLLDTTVYRLPFVASVVRCHKSHGDVAPVGIGLVAWRRGLPHSIDFRCSFFFCHFCKIFSYNVFPNVCINIFKEPGHFFFFNYKNVTKGWNTLQDFCSDFCPNLLSRWVNNSCLKSVPVCRFCPVGLDRVHRKTCSVWWVQTAIFLLQTMIVW